MLVGSAAGVDPAQIPTAGPNLDTILLEHQGSQGICAVFGRNSSRTASPQHCSSKRPGFTPLRFHSQRVRRMKPVVESHMVECFAELDRSLQV